MDLPAFEHIPGLPLPLLRGGEHPCPYLPGKIASELFALPIAFEPELYQSLMDHGFRRTDELAYRPACPACRECVPMRVPVASFALSNSQRRVLRRNEDVAVDVGPLCADDERFALFTAYQLGRHDGDMLADRDEFSRFLCESPIDSMEMTFRVNGRLVGVGVIDVCPTSISSVYFYFDPAEARRSLGIFSCLCEIDECRRRGLRHWYPGFLVAGSRKMNYKATFRPHELLLDGRWTPAEDAVDARSA